MSRLTVVIEIDRNAGPKAFSVAKSIAEDVLYHEGWSRYVLGNLSPALNFSVEWRDKDTLLVRHEPKVPLTIVVPVSGLSGDGEGP